MKKFVLLALLLTSCVAEVNNSVIISTPGSSNSSWIEGRLIWQGDHSKNFNCPGYSHYHLYKGRWYFHK